MPYSGEQILSFKSCLVFYAGDSLNNLDIIFSCIVIYFYNANKGTRTTCLRAQYNNMHGHRYVYVHAHAYAYDDCGLHVPGFPAYVFKTYIFDLDVLIKWPPHPRFYCRMRGIIRVKREA